MSLGSDFLREVEEPIALVGDALGAAAKEKTHTDRSAGLSVTQRVVAKHQTLVNTFDRNTSQGTAVCGRKTVVRGHGLRHPAFLFSGIGPVEPVEAG